MPLRKLNNYVGEGRSVKGSKAGHRAGSGAVTLAICRRLLLNSNVVGGQLYNVSNIHIVYQYCILGYGYLLKIIFILISFK